MALQHDLVPFVEALNDNHGLSPQQRVDRLETKLREAGVDNAHVLVSETGQVSWVEIITTIT